MAFPWGSRTPGFRVMKTRAFIGAPMTAFEFRGKLYPLFTVQAHPASVPACIPARGGSDDLACTCHLRFDFRLGGELFRVGRPGGEGAACAVHLLHPRLAVRI